MANPNYPTHKLIDKKITLSSSSWVEHDKNSDEYYTVYTAMTDQLFPDALDWEWYYHEDLKFYEHKFRLTLQDLSDLIDDPAINAVPHLKSRFINDRVTLNDTIVKKQQKDIQAQFNSKIQSDKAAEVARIIKSIHLKRPKLR